MRASILLSSLALALLLSPAGLVHADPEVTGVQATEQVAGSDEKGDPEGDPATDQNPPPIPRNPWPAPITKTFELSVEDAIRIALSNSHDVQIARLDRSIQMRQQEIERAVFDPNFVTSSDMARNRQPTVTIVDVGAIALTGDVVLNRSDSWTHSLALNGRSIVGTQYEIRVGQTKFDQPDAFDGGVIGFETQDTLTVRAEITQPLLRRAWSGYNSGRMRIAANSKTISEFDLELAATELVYRVEVAYWQLSFATKNHEAKTSAHATASKSYEDFREENELGTRSDSDLLTARSQLLLRQVELSEAHQLLLDSRDQFMLLLNQSGIESRRRLRRGNLRGLFDHVWIVPTSEPNTEPFVADRGMAMETAFDRRPEYRRIELEIENQQIQGEITSNEALPNLDLRARWEMLGLDEGFNDSMREFGSGDFYNWSVGIELSFPLGNRGPRNQHLQSQEVLRQLRLRKLQIESDIFAEIDRSLRSLRSLHGRVRDLDERVGIQQQLLDKENEKLELGRTVYYTVSILQDDLVESQALALRAKAEYEAAKANYYRVNGTLLTQRLGNVNLLRRVNPE